jgi:hypothetical protein
VPYFAKKKYEVGVVIYYMQARVKKDRDAFRHRCNVKRVLLYNTEIARTLLTLLCKAFEVYSTACSISCYYITREMVILYKSTKVYCCYMHKIERKT